MIAPLFRVVQHAATLLSITRLTAAAALVTITGTWTLLVLLLLSICLMILLSTPNAITIRIPSSTTTQSAR